MICHIRRMKGLVRFLLLLLLALPGLQAGAHEAGTAPARVMAMHEMATMHHDHHGGPADAPLPAHAVHHDCLGCIAPIDVSLYRAASAPYLIVSRGSPPARTAYLLARVSAPEPPPPRAAV
jgi:hypothetical protein